MKNRQKSRSGCRTCKLRRLRCDETKPGCRNCAQKGFECPGYQKRLQWSTKHEIPTTATTAKTSGPPNFTQLVTAASESIVAGAKPATPVKESSPDGDKASLVLPIHTGSLTVPYRSVSTSTSQWTSVSPSPASSSSSSSSSSLSSTPSPPPEHEDPAASTGDPASTVSVDAPVVALKTEPGLAEEAITAPELTMYQPVVDIPTFLIEHWFKSVCPLWSALDSPSNPYRRLTAELWRSSSSVYYSLQSISAASLVERLPHVMRDTARSAPHNALAAIRKEAFAFFNGHRPRFPAELLLALFCMSSSMCWMESRQLGQELVRQARRVLRSLSSSPLDSASLELLEFFNGCLVYEEMLRSVVSEEDIDFENMLSWPEPVARRPLIPPVPHPWTGVSPDILRLFGKAMALCRRSRTRWRHNGGTSYRILQGAMKDIADAKRVEEALLPAGLTQRPECRPPRTMTCDPDLHYVTEAYRLCALLQLYETFPDLCAQRIPNMKDADGSTIWRLWVSPLALHITDVLRSVPAGSLSCIQPLLCLCAGSGLRYDSKVQLGSGQNNYLLSAESSEPATPTPVATDAAFPSINPGVSDTAVRTSQARQFIMHRLEQLELSLPPKPIGVARQLQRAVWNAYDGEIGLTRRTHWLDVMSHTGLHSLFG